MSNRNGSASRNGTKIENKKENAAKHALNLAA
jgi:hypothetical protein